MNLNNCTKDISTACTQLQKSNNIKRNVILINQGSQETTTDSPIPSAKPQNEILCQKSSLPFSLTEKELTSHTLPILSQNSKLAKLY